MHVEAERNLRVRWEARANCSVNSGAAGIESREAIEAGKEKGYRPVTGVGNGQKSVTRK